MSGELDAMTEFPQESATRLRHLLFDNLGNPRPEAAATIGWVCVRPFEDHFLPDDDEIPLWMYVAEPESYHVLNIFGWIKEWLGRPRFVPFWMTESEIWEQRRDVGWADLWTDIGLTFMASSTEDGRMYLCASPRVVDRMVGENRYRSLWPASHQ